MFVCLFCANFVLSTRLYLILILLIHNTKHSHYAVNADLYCKLGLPFVMGTTGGDKQLLYKSVQDSKNYALISPQMGKQVVAFVAAMKIMANQFPGAFSGYNLEVLESHQAGKLDTSGTAKDVIACFEKLGVSYDMNRVCSIFFMLENLYILYILLRK
uniref:Dihydrodipicolinate reductase n=1 Tax=Arundo donax TaxID=35708 RepID=A0A0A9DQQ2_ARUDO